MPMDSDSEEWEEVSRGWSTSPSSGDSTQGDFNTEESINEILIPGYLDLLDLPALARLQHSLSGPSGSSHHLGVVSTVGTLLLGEGGSFVVRRVHYSSFLHAIDTWDEPFDRAKRFVVVKQPLIEEHTSPNSTDRPWIRNSDKLRAVTTELKVLSHGPIRKHPNIVKLHHFVWDTQGSLVSGLAPSPILEYADLGTLDDYQDGNRLLDGEEPRIYLHADAKIDICADVAQGLAFLHRCGVVHGDVKTGNVLLFRDQIHHPRRVAQIRAKVSDFGSALIGVFDNAPKQERHGKTQYWAAPDPREPMDALTLRRTDIYSYGLMVWQVMSNGHKPSTLLLLGPDDRTTVSLSATQLKPGPDDSLKLNLLKHKPDDLLLRLAVDSLRGRPRSDVDFDRTGKVLELTLRKNSLDRAESFEQVLEVLNRIPDMSSTGPTVESEPLPMGSISYSWPTFPRDIYACRTTPQTFRRLICDQLAAKADSNRVDSTPTQKAEASLALGTCCLQGFYPGPYDVDSNNDQTHSSLQLATESIFKSAQFGSPLAQTMASRFPQKSHPHLPNRKFPAHDDIEQWLVHAMCHGSLSARFELQTKFPEAFERTTRAIRESRSAKGAVLQKETDGDTSPDCGLHHDLVSDIHFMTKKILQRPGVQPIHQAGFLGRLDICQKLISASGENLDLRTENNETPLHFASRGAHMQVIDFLLRSGADIGAKTKDGLSVLHMALLSLEPVPILALLLARGADPSIWAPSSATWLPDCYDCLVGVEASPLHMAVRLGSEEIAKTLLEGGANPNLKDENGTTPLQSALMIRSRAMLELLLPYAVRDMENLPNPWALYPALVGFFTMPMTKQLFWDFCGNGDSTGFITYAADHLRAAGIGIEDRALFSWALEADDAELVDHFGRKLVNGSGQTHEPLMKPFRERSFHEESTGTRPTDIDLRPDLHSILNLAIQFRSLPVIASLMEYIKKPIPPKWSNGTPVFCALASRALDSWENIETIVDVLVSAGADTKAVDVWGKGPLTIAAFFNNYQLAEALLRYDCSDHDIEKCLQICISKGDTKTGKQIMESIFNHKPQVLVYPLPVVPQNGSLLFESSEANWIRSFCSASEFSLAGNTILRSKSKGEDLEEDYKQPADEVLLKEAIKTALSQSRGSMAVTERLNERAWPTWRTPLHEAAARGNLGIAKILLENGASVNAFDSIGRPFPALGDILGGVDISLFGQATDSEGVEWKDEKDVASLPSDQKFEASIMCGKTALDYALARDWASSLSEYPQEDIPLLKKLRNVGGAHREEDAFTRRTINMVAFLREMGGKTHREIFGMPDFKAMPPPSTGLGRTDSNQALPTRPHQQTATKKQNPEQDRSNTTRQRISSLWGCAADLPSQTLIHNIYPQLHERTDPNLPRLSSVYEMSTELFVRVLNTATYENLPEREVRLITELRDQQSRLGEWASQNSVQTGALDRIQGMPGSTPPSLLAASVFVCLFEIRQTLGYMLDLVNGQRGQKMLDYPNRFKELLGDLRKVVDILATQGQGLKELSDDAVKELEQESEIKITDLDLDGNLR